MKAKAQKRMKRIMQAMQETEQEVREEMSTLYEITGQYLELYKMMECRGASVAMKVITDTLDGMDGELGGEGGSGYAKIYGGTGCGSCEV